jgi:DNA-directed RNA polymerase subunit beta'
MQPSTIGQYLVNQALPEKYRDPSRIMDSKTMNKLFSTIALEAPNEYPDVLFKLNQIATEAHTARGGLSPSVRHFKESPGWRKHRELIRKEVKSIYSNPDLSPQEKRKKMLDRLMELSPQLTKETFGEADAADNPLAWVVRSGAKGKPANVNNLLGSPLLFSDAKNRVIPIPILNGYAKGLSPSEYWAASYGTRKGVSDTKLSVADAGFVSKQLVQIAHRSVVTDDDDPDNIGDETRGLPVDADDDDNIGALLARSAGDYGRDTIITAKVLRNLRRQGIKRLLVRSPIVGGPQDGSIYAKDAGLREMGRLPVRGENPGVSAAQALAEPLSQATLSSKHSAGVVGASAGAISGFKAINQLIQVPKESSTWASHAKKDGLVQHIDKAPQGGHYVYIDNDPVYVAPGNEISVKPGDEIEAGDIISSGLPNPATVVAHKGIGEGRRYFTNTLLKTLRDSGINVSRRNVELIARGLVNHVELDAEMDAYIPGDTVPYNMLEKFYQPRQDAQETSAGNAIGKYLERPVLHYTIGTKVRPSVQRDLEEFGLGGNILVHNDPPPFRPQMIRGMAIAANDPDWITSMQGSGIKRRLMEAVHRGHHSDTKGTSYVSGVVGDLNFVQKGNSGKIESPLYHLNEMKQKRLEAPANPFDLSDED